MGVLLIAVMLRVLTVLICVHVFLLDRDGLCEEVKLEMLIGIRAGSREPPAMFWAQEIYSSLEGDCRSLGQASACLLGSP